MLRELYASKMYTICSLWILILEFRFNMILMYTLVNTKEYLKRLLVAPSQREEV